LKAKKDVIQVSFLNLIDLAGSEGVSKTNATGARKKLILIPTPQSPS
jgi:hypothetical protein